VRLLTKPGGNAKLAKGNGPTFAPYILHLAPFTSGGAGINTCPNASPECISLCLNVSGRANIFPEILSVRAKKTKLLATDRPTFLARLRREIANAIKREAKRGRVAVFRLNGTSDIDFSEVISAFPSVRFYDYTKDPVRYNRYLLGLLPRNYHLTFSFSGRNIALCRSFLARGGNVAAAFARPIGTSYHRPEQWEGFRTIDGDISDLRFLDNPGTVVALKAKGKARKASGNPFIIGS
jgi:Gene product 88